MPDALTRFYDTSRRIFDLSQARQTLEWDQRTVMPPKGVGQRSQQLSALASVLHGQSTDPALGDLIAELETRTDLEETVRADVREARRAFDRATKIPARLVAARAEACALAETAWEAAKLHDDFAAFLPHLERVIALTREQAACLDAANPYDALLGEYEPGMSEAQLKALFADLKARLAPILDAVQGAPRPDTGFLARHFPEQGQRAFCLRVLEDMGFDLQAGRFDTSAHPCTDGTLQDVRLTTRYQEDYLPGALFGTLHEGGHGLYEQGLDQARFRDPAGLFCSMGIHESQSRLWENLIGRSLPFWRHYHPELRRTFPGRLEDVSLDAFYRAVNVVEPSLVRIEADEATYNLHIILRFELESDLIAGRVQPRELPEQWRGRMQASLGVAPTEDREGVLQDVHWAAGLIGYFPTYTLGNLYAAQFMEAMRRDLPDLDDALARGELGPARAWLNRNIHRHGRRWTAPELCEKVTGQALAAEPLLRHLRRKYSGIYGIMGE